MVHFELRDSVPNEYNTKMLYGTKYALFVMPCNAGKIKCLVNSQTKQTLNMSPVPFELKDHSSTIIAYSSLSSFALLIKNSSVSHAKKKHPACFSDISLRVPFVIDSG